MRRVRCCSRRGSTHLSDRITLRVLSPCAELRQPDPGELMAITPPDAARLAALNEHFNFGLSESELDTFAPAVASTFAASGRVEELYEASAPAMPDRAWAQPADNPLGAWYVTTSIKGAAEGPLVGKTVAIKDNVSVAGVPMTNGSRTVEGFVPRRDATVVTRLLAAGATITGKAMCEDLCFSGASFTSQ